MTSGTMDPSVFADLLDSLSPLKANGIDPELARTDRAATMAKLLGSSDAAQPKWYEQAQNDGAPAGPSGQRLSPNGNALPAGLYSRQQPAPATTPTAGPGAASSPPSEPGAPMSPTRNGEPIGRKVFVPAAGTTPAVPASVAPSGDPSTLANSNTGTINAMQQDYGRASQDVAAEAAQPDEATVLAPLERQRVSAQRRQVELDSPNDPKTGKMLPEYRPSFGQRLMRTAGAVARGGVLGALDPEGVGATPYGAPNKQYAIDRAQAAARVAGADHQLQDAKDAWTATSTRLGKIATDRRALATMGKDVTGAATSQEQIPIDQQKADSDSARAYNDSPAGKAEAARELNTESLSDRQAQIADPKNPISKASRQDQAYFLASGRLPDPDRYHAPAEQVLFSHALEAWHHDNDQPGKPAVPGLEDLRKIAASAKGSDPDAIENARSEATRVRAAGAQLTAATRRLVAAQKADGDNLDPKKQSGIDAELQEAQRAYDDAQAAMAPAAPAPPAATRGAPVVPAREGSGNTGSTPRATPPASLLRTTPEGGVIYGRGGEVFKKEGGRWIAQRPQ